MELKLFGTDEFKQELAVFFIDMGEDLNAYIWVDADGSIDITDIYRVASYCNHSVSPFYVGKDMPEEFIEDCYNKIVEMPEDQKVELLEKFNERIENQKKNEEDYKEREEYEDGIMKEWEEKKNSEDGMLWLM